MRTVLAAVCLTALAIFWGGYARDYILVHEKRMKMETKIQLLQTAIEFEQWHKWQPRHLPQPQPDKPSVEVKPELKL